MTRRRWAADRRSGPGRTRSAPSFVRSRKVERYYAAQLRKIAAHVAHLVETADPTNMADRLRQYAETLKPWAASVAERMIADVSRLDRQAWRERSAEMGRLLKAEIETAPTGQAMQRILREQVGLITSLPTEAAERVHKLTMEAITTGTRAETLAKEIAKTGEVTKARANTIARTEVSRTASALTQARAEHIGSTTYIWRTSGDSDVRPSHRAMEGKAVEWSKPPTLDGLTGHAGALPNCRCYPEPVIPDIED